MTRVLLVALLSGCGAPTEIVVRVESAVAAHAPFHSTGRMDTSAGGVFDDVCFNLDYVAPPAGALVEPPKGDPSWKSAVELGDSACPSVELAVVARGDWKGRDFGVQVTGGASCDPTALAASPTPEYMFTSGSSPFEEGRVTLLTLTLTDGCVASSDGNTQCMPSQTCVAPDHTFECVPVPTLTAPPPYAPNDGGCQ